MNENRRGGGGGEEEENALIHTPPLSLSLSFFLSFFLYYLLSSCSSSWFVHSQELKVLSRDLTLCNQVSRGLDSLGQFELHDLVKLDART